MAIQIGQKGLKSIQIGQDEVKEVWIGDKLVWSNKHTITVFTDSGIAYHSIHYKLPNQEWQVTYDYSIALPPGTPYFISVQIKSNYELNNPPFLGSMSNPLYLDKDIEYELYTYYVEVDLPFTVYFLDMGGGWLNDIEWTIQYGEQTLSGTGGVADIIHKGGSLYVEWQSNYTLKSWNWSGAETPTQVTATYVKWDNLWGSGVLTLNFDLI